MTTYTKPRSKKLKFNQIDISVASLMVHEITVEAQHLSLLLSTFSSPLNHAGRVAPTMERLKTMLPFADRLEEVILKLVQGGNWAVQFDEITGEPVNYIPLFMQNTALMEAAKKYSTGVNQIKNLRYAGLSSRATIAIAGVLVGFRTKYTDLGYSVFKKQGIIPPHQLWYRENGKMVGRKLCHGAHFRHSLLEVGSLQANETLARITTLPDSMLTKPMSRTMVVSEFKAFGFTKWSQVYSAFAELRRSGDWLVDLPPAEGKHPWDRTVIFTPTNKQHRAVWELEMRTGGKNQTAWEIRNGFYPSDKSRNSKNLGSSSPDLGMHTHYLLLDPISKKPLYSGQTTLPANHRLRLHMVGTTPELSEPNLLNGRELTDKPLIMLPTAQVHVSRISEFEMRAIEVFEEAEEAEYEFLNTVRNAYENRRTIHLDPQLQEMGSLQRYAFLNSVWATHGNVNAVDLSAYPHIKEIMDKVIAEFSVNEPSDVDLSEYQPQNA